MVKKQNKILILVLVLAGLFLLRGVIVRSVLSAGVRAVTGMKLEIRRLDISLMKGRVAARGVRLMNPPGFSEPVMADLPELSVEADMPALLRGKTHVKELTVDLSRFNVVKDARGRVNLDALTSVQKAKGKEKSSAPGSLQIDHLHLKVGTVTYRDEAPGAAIPLQEFPVNLDEHYRDITDPTALGALIVSRALFNTTIARLAQFDLGSVQSAAGSLQKIGEGAVETVGGAVEGVLDRFKKVIE